MRKLCVAILLAIACAWMSAVSAGEPPQARNVIVMIADGWGFRQTEAASLYRYGKPGGQDYAAFPVKVAMTTWPNGGSYSPDLAWTDFGYVNGGVTDSAAAATALSTGVKTYNGAIGVDVNRKPVRHALEEARDLGLAVGVVTSVPLSHATPAGFVAHSADRNSYAAIARQMIYESGAYVIMGCGNPEFDDNGKPGRSGFDYVGGEETWKDLLSGKADADCPAGPWTLVQTREQFQSLALAKSPPQRVIGVPQVASTLQQHRGGDANAAPFAVPLTETVPTLQEMTLAALNVLASHKKGLFLMVEGGAIDSAGHSNQSGRSIEEQLQFDDAVSAVIKWVEKNSSWDETLVIVTGDHETGYLTRPAKGGDDTPWSWQPLPSNGKGKLPDMRWNSGSHTNSLLPIFAKGVFSDMFKELAKNQDPHYGPYVDNTDVSRVAVAALRGKMAASVNSNSK